MTEPTPAPHDLTRQNLAERTVEWLSRGGRRNPDVVLAESLGRRVVVKDFAPRGRLVRATLGRWITAREMRAWRALRDHPAVPAFLGPIDALAFAVEFRPGQRLARKLRGSVPPDFVERMRDAFDEMHRCGVVHLDLRHRDNVLVDAAGRPVLIDFGSALCFRPGGLAARWLLPLFAWIDLRALEKWRARLGPAD